MRTTILLLAFCSLSFTSLAQIKIEVSNTTERSVIARTLAEPTNKASESDTLFHASDAPPATVEGEIWVALTDQQQRRAPQPLNTDSSRVWFIALTNLNGKNFQLPADGKPYVVRTIPASATTSTTVQNLPSGTGQPADSIRISASGAGLKTIVSLQQGMSKEVGCGAYALYFIGPNKPEGLEWKGKCPVFRPYKRLAPEGFIRAQRGGEKIYRTYLGSDFCGQGLHLKYLPTTKGSAVGRYYLVPLDARTGFQRSSDPGGGNCDGPFNSCSSFAKYRITYDVRQSQLYVQRRLRHDRGDGLWKTVNGRIIRPGVNRMIDLRMINFNELRDSVSAGYNFENLNQQNSAEFLNAVFSIPTGTAAAVEGTETPASSKGPPSPPSNDDTTAQKAQKEKDAKEDTTKVESDLASLDTLYESFQAELKAAQGAVVTPDKELLKAKLDKLVSTAFPEYFPKGSTKALGDGLRELIAKGKKYKRVTDEKEKELDKKVTEMERIHGLLTTYRAFALAPIQMRDYDLLQLQFKLNGKPLNQSAYEIYSKGGWKIDFSTGVVITSLRDSKFFLDGIRSTTDTLGVDTSTNAPITKSTYFSTTKESTKEPFDWGVAVMAHLYPRLGIIPNISITTGAMIRQEGVRWLGGASILLGRRERLVLTGGVAWGKVDRLKDGRKTETETSSEAVITEDTVVPTQKVNDTGWFVSASWNFGGARLTR